MRHGRCVALGIAIRTNPDLLMSDMWNGRVMTAVRNYCSADRVPVCMSGLRALGYVLGHHVSNGKQPEPALMAIITKVCNFA